MSTEAKDLIKRMLCLEASKRITVDEALMHPWFHPPQPGAAAAAPVGLMNERGSNVREVMKEFNAKRAMAKLTNLRQRGRKGSIDEGQGVGPIEAVRNFVGRRPSAAADAVALAAAAATSGSPGGKKFARRRGSNANSDQIQEAAGGR